MAPVNRLGVRLQHLRGDGVVGFALVRGGAWIISEDAARHAVMPQSQESEVEARDHVELESRARWFRSDWPRRHRASTQPAGPGSTPLREPSGRGHRSHSSVLGARRRAGRD